MLKARQYQVLNEANIALIQLRNFEIQYFNQFFHSFGTQSAVVGGIMVAALSQTPALKNLHNGIGFAYVYWTFTVLGILTGLYCIISSLYVTVFGSGLALRGPVGSMLKATKGMVDEQNTMILVFTLTLVFANISLIGIYFLQMSFYSAVISSLINIVGLATWYFACVRIYNRFQYVNKHVDAMTMDNKNSTQRRFKRSVNESINSDFYNNNSNANDNTFYNTSNNANNTNTASILTLTRWGLGNNKVNNNNNNNNNTETNNLTERLLPGHSAAAAADETQLLLPAITYSDKLFSTPTATSATSGATTVSSASKKLQKMLPKFPHIHLPFIVNPTTRKTHPNNGGSSNNNDADGDETVFYRGYITMKVYTNVTTSNNSSNSNNNNNKIQLPSFMHGGTATATAAATASVGGVNALVAYSAAGTDSGDFQWTRKYLTIWYATTTATATSSSAAIFTFNHANDSNSSSSKQKAKSHYSLWYYDQEETYLSSPDATDNSREIDISGYTVEENVSDKIFEIILQPPRMIVSTGGMSMTSVTAVAGAAGTGGSSGISNITNSGTNSASHAVSSNFHKIHNRLSQMQLQQQHSKPNPSTTTPATTIITTNLQQQQEPIRRKYEFRCDTREEFMQWKRVFIYVAQQQLL